ncbi:hypothetical protein AWZ03_003706 [Drosophila navojoa]|uniref:Uncharacterized protein n=1 Tax=Drosophila navojoa TaxID=7232 RepID=A0A484BPF1_DRONA|nr:hypothetical protein AWZ03_003706 [Drosophila navojoa]
MQIAMSRGPVQAAKDLSWAGAGRCSAGICIMAATHCSGSGNPKSAHLQLSMSRAYDCLSSLSVQPVRPAIVLPNMPFHSTPFQSIPPAQCRCRDAENDDDDDDDEDEDEDEDDSSTSAHMRWW